MPMTFEIDSGAGIVRATASGHLTAAELYAYFRASREATGFRPDMNRLVITSNILSFPSAAEVQAISVELRQRAASPAVRFAIVATTPLALGMANMFFLQAGLDDRFATFTDEASARAWLTQASNRPR